METIKPTNKQECDEIAITSTSGKTINCDECKDWQKCKSVLKTKGH